MLHPQVIYVLVVLTGECCWAGFEHNIRVKWPKFSLNPPLRMGGIVERLPATPLRCLLNFLWTDALYN